MSTTIPTQPAHNEASTPLEDLLISKIVSQISKSKLPKEAKQLIGPAIKHFMAAKLNKVTGERIKFLRNWEESSANALMKSINDTISPLINKELPGIKEKTHNLLQTVFASADSYTFGVAGLALGGLKDVGDGFIDVVCDTLGQVEAGVQPQTVNRLLTLMGGLYTGNAAIKAIIDRNKGLFFDDFFKRNGLLEKILNKTLSEKLGEKWGNFWAGPLEKFALALVSKDFVDKFLTKRILEGKSSAEVLRSGDVYEKLILKGISNFIAQTEGEMIDLDVLLNDEKLTDSLKNQILELRKRHADSIATRWGLYLEKSLANGLVAHFKDKDIVLMTRAELKGCLKEFGVNYLVDTAKSYSDRSVEIVKETATNIVEKTKNAASAIVKATANVGTSVISGAKKVVNMVAVAATGVLNWFFSSKSSPSSVPQEAASKKQEVLPERSDTIMDDFEEYSKKQSNETSEMEKTPTKTPDVSPLTTSEAEPDPIAVVTNAVDEIQTPPIVEKPAESVPSELTNDKAPSALQKPTEVSERPEAEESLSTEKKALSETEANGTLANDGFLSKVGSVAVEGAKIVGGLLWAPVELIGAGWSWFRGTAESAPAKSEPEAVEEAVSPAEETTEDHVAPLEDEVASNAAKFKEEDVEDASKMAEGSRSENN